MHQIASRLNKVCNRIMQRSTQRIILFVKRRFIASSRANTSTKIFSQPRYGSYINRYTQGYMYNPKIAVFSSSLFPSNVHILSEKQQIFNEKCATLEHIVNTLKQTTSLTDFYTFNVLLSEFRNLLNNIRNEFDRATWIEFVHHLQNNQKAFNAILLPFLEDPLTKRVYEQPRGYAGDAVTIDMIYTKQHNISNVTKLGQIIFDSCNLQCVSARGTADRARFIGSYLDKSYKTKLTNNYPLNIPLTALSIACGHCREIDHSLEFWKGNINVCAFDQDDVSLETVNTDYTSKGYNITTINGKVSRLGREKYCNENIVEYNAGEKFDFIWSAGLFDYLPQKTAMKLTQNIFKYLLKSNGTLLIGNWVHSDEIMVGHLELFNWKIVYRSLDEMEKFAKNINSADIKSIRTFDYNAIGYLEIKKNTA